MKKLGGVFVSVMVLVAAFFTVAFAPTEKTIVNASSGREYSVSFEDSSYGITGGRENGIFIIRDAAMVADADEADVYTGGVFVDPSITISQTFMFESVKETGGEWYTAKEYAVAFQDMPDTVGGIGNYMQLDGDTGKPNSSGMCNWEMRVKNPAGKYGIRARAMKQIIEQTENGVEQRYEYLYYDDLKQLHVEYFFVILYGEDLQYLSCVDEQGSTMYSVKDRGLGKDILISIVANDGAMRVSDMTGYLLITKDEFGDGFEAGILREESTDIRYSDVNITIERNGKAIDLPYTFVSGGINITLPATLPSGRYVVTASHSYNNQILGTYVIDNGNPVTEPGSTKGAGIVLIILGLVALGGGLFLFVMPHFIYGVQAKRYQNIEDKIYKADARSVKQQEKKDKEAKASGQKEIKNAKTRSFIEGMAQYRESRAQARESGMTMEEYREVEKQQKYQREVSEFNMTEARSLEGTQDIIETVKEEIPEITRKEGEPEFELLDSVRAEGAFVNEEYGDTIIRPNVQESVENIVEENNETPKDEPTDEAPNPKDETPPTAPTGGGILSRIRNLSE